MGHGSSTHARLARANRARYTGSVEEGHRPCRSEVHVTPDRIRPAMHLCIGLISDEVNMSTYH